MVLFVQKSRDGVDGKEKIHTYVRISSGRIHKKFQTVVASEVGGWGWGGWGLHCILLCASRILNFVNVFSVQK